MSRRASSWEHARGNNGLKCVLYANSVNVAGDTQGMDIGAVGRTMLEHIQSYSAHKHAMRSIKTLEAAHVSGAIPPRPHQATKNSAFRWDEGHHAWIRLPTARSHVSPFGQGSRAPCMLSGAPPCGGGGVWGHHSGGIHCGRSVLPHDSRSSRPGQTLTERYQASMRGNEGLGRRRSQPHADDRKHASTAITETIIHAPPSGV